MASPSPYADCVDQLRSALTLLDSSVNTLGAGVEDFPRLVSVLKSVRVCVGAVDSISSSLLPHDSCPSSMCSKDAPCSNHTRANPTTNQHFELIPQTTLAAAEASLRDEIGPSVTLLLDRAERQLDRIARRIETLKARSELQQGRLSHGGEGLSALAAGAARPRSRGGKPTRGGNGNNNSSGGATRLDAEGQLRAKLVRQRKEALKYGVERLEMEVRQKEREMRKRSERSGGGGIDVAD